MDNTSTEGPLAAFYSESVEREREAWQALQSVPPGSIGRARAWEAWSNAISLTITAWRQLSVGRTAKPHARA